ncbi:MAG: helix-turn-helix domain-containing protein [Halobacteriales archaeon]
MARLADVTADTLRAHLDDVEGRRPTLRLVVGINYKAGVTQSELADWYGLSRTTVHNWLTRLERLPDEPPEEVLYDAERPGRPSKLSDEEWGELLAMLEDSPETFGFDAARWSSRVVQRLIREQFGVEYSRRHVRYLLDRADVA